MTEIALFFVSVGLMLTSLKARRLQKSMSALLAVVAEIVVVMNLQHEINKNLVAKSDIDEELKRMLDGR